VDRRAGRLAQATRSNYRHHIAALTAEGLGGRPLNVVKRSDVERWQTEGVAAGTGKPTLNARLKVLGMIYRDAMAEIPEAVTHNPTTGVAPLTLDIKPDRVLTAAEETALLAAAGPDNRLPVLLALDAGLRWSEAFGLPEDAVMGDYLVVRQVVERDTGALRHYPKGHRARVVPLTPRLAGELRAAAAAARKARGAGALLFVSEVGGTVDYFNYRHRTYRPMVRAAKIKPAPGFHALRHTYGTRLADASVPRAEIAVLMGHADEETTKRYIHAGDDGRRLALVRGALAKSA
jgi:integrase